MPLRRPGDVATRGRPHVGRRGRDGRSPCPGRRTRRADRRRTSPGPPRDRTNRRSGRRGRFPPCIFTSTAEGSPVAGDRKGPIAEKPVPWDRRGRVACRAEPLGRRRHIDSSRAGMRELRLRVGPRVHVLPPMRHGVGRGAPSRAAQDGDRPVLRPDRLDRARRDARSRTAACAARALLRADEGDRRAARRQRREVHRRRRDGRVRRAGAARGRRAAGGAGGCRDAGCAARARAARDGSAS